MPKFPFEYEHGLVRVTQNKIIAVIKSLDVCLPDCTLAKTIQAYFHNHLQTMYDVHQEDKLAAQ